MANRHASKGESILFTRRGNQIEGKVFLVRDNSVLVDISAADAVLLGLESLNTVVAHKNYKILKRNKRKKASN